jgi:hypothetical protein
MLNLLYCLLVPGVSPDAVLDRYVALRKKAPAIEMVYRSAGMKANLTLVPNKMMRLEAKGAGRDYLCLITPKGMIDFDHAEREYDELPATRTTTPPSRISNVGGTFPTWIMQSDLRKLVPAETKFVGQGRRTVGRVSGELLKATYDSEGAHTVEVLLDDAGAPIEIKQHGVLPMGAYRQEWTVERFKPIALPPASRFAMKIPDGYVPFSLDVIHGPMGVGNNFPLEGWRGGNLKSHLAKGGLIAILSANSEPSRRAGAALAKIKGAGTSVVTLGDAAGVPGTDGYDPSGALLARAGVPSTPVFFKVDSKGKISAVWLGFDPANADAFVREATAK